MTTLSDDARLCQTSGMTRRTAVLYSVSMNGFADDYAGNPDWGDGMERIGRHILMWDNRGFFESDSFEDDEACEEAFWIIANELYPQEEA